MLFLAFPLWMQGQSAREEIGKNPALAAGKYYAYQAPEEKLTPAPAGYEPFYISMFARHGSRYLTKEKKYAAPLSLLLEADEEGVLTSNALAFNLKCTCVLIKTYLRLRGNVLAF